MRTASNEVIDIKVVVALHPGLRAVIARPRLRVTQVMRSVTHILGLKLFWTASPALFVTLRVRYPRWVRKLEAIMYKGFTRTETFPV